MVSSATRGVRANGDGGPGWETRQPRGGGTRRKLCAAALLGAALALTLAGCTKTATHEAGAPADSQYNEVVASGGQATYQVGSTDHAFEGSRSAKATFTGSASPPASKAYGMFNFATATGTYSAGLYFPTGTLTGASPLQHADVDVMRWENAQDFGGIRISGSDHKARLVRGSLPSSTAQPIGESFRLQEGCWNWVAVRQQLSDKSYDPGQPNDPNYAQSEVWLNGRKVVESQQPNRSSASGSATSARFGMPYIDAATQGNTSFTYYVDNSTISTLGNNTPTSGLCTPPRPNVLFIVTDDQPPLDTMHAMPNTTKWFRDGGHLSNGNGITGGTEFSEGYATTPLCCPARASILSGQMAHNHGVRGNDQGDALPEDIQLQTYLDNAGYETGLVGKYLNDWSIYEPPPHFDKWWHTAGYAPNSYVNANGTINQTGLYETSYLKNKAIEFLDGTESNDTQPWFMYLAPSAPHEAGKYPYSEMNDSASSSCWNGTYQPPAPASVPSRSEGIGGSDPITDKPQWVRDWTDDRAIFLPYTGPPAGGPLRDQMLRALCSADQMVDAVLNRMKENEEERDTLAFFIGDNGYMLREHGMASNEIFDNNNLGYVRTKCIRANSACGPTAKNKPYTESIKVPFYMRWPANIYSPIGIDAGRYVANTDLTPTVLDAAALSGGPMDGRSLYDRTQDRSQIVTEGWNSFGAETWAGIRGRSGTSTFHYIEYYQDNGATLRQDNGLNDDGTNTVREFYDLTADPFELTNLLRDGNPATPNAALLADAADRLRRERLCSGSNCLPGIPPSTVTDQNSPRTWINTPLPGAVIDKVVKFSAGASDNLGVQSVEFWRDNQLVATDTSPPYETTFDASTLATGAHTVKAVANDAAGHPSPEEIPVRVERYDVQGTNVAGGTAGQMQNGDSITYSFDRAISPGTIKSGWNGSALTVTARLSPDDPAHRYYDVLSIDGVASLGVVDLGRADHWGLRQLPVIDKVFTGSTMVLSGDQRSVTVTFGGGTPAGGSLADGTMVWTPGSSICPVSPSCPIHESVTAGETKDF